MMSDMTEKETRPPVVAVLGHVDHGKSSLLEAIREDFVILEKESGGITQHIGAYEVEVEGKKITFIDTPGHEAFSAMRQRGAHVADIAILVIDASEGIKDQTKEAIKFIQKADIPMIIAFNKMDKPGADPEKVKGQLGKEDILVESYGGKIPSVNISAKQKQGIKELLETVLLVAELEELVLDLESKPEGTVIESSLDPQKGAVSTLILNKGVLKNGDIIATHYAFGKVKGLSDFEGKPIEKALPSQPVIVLGFNRPPGVGEVFHCCSCLSEAEEKISKRERKNLFIIEEDKKALNIILKADVLGSLEAVENVLANIPKEKVALRVLKADVGDIGIGDVKMAESSRAMIIGFRVKADETSKVFARQRGIKIKTFEVIYELVQEVRKDMMKVLEPETKRIDLGKFKISHLFKQSKKEQIVGGKVLEGEMTRNIKAEVFREEEKQGKGRIKGLQKEKQDVGKATKGQEVGILFEGDVKLAENDVLHIFREEKEKGTL